MRASTILFRATFFLVLIFYSSLLFPSSIIIRATGNCPQVGAPESMAIDGDNSTFFSHTQCGLHLKLDLATSIKAARIRVSANRSNIRVGLPGQENYYITTQNEDEFFVLVPNGFSTFTLWSNTTARHKIYEVEVVQIYNIASFESDYRYDNAGNMIIRSIVLSRSKRNVADSLMSTGYKDEPGLDEELPPAEDQILSNKILIYPNPTRGQLRVQLDGFDPGINNSVNIEVHTMGGVKIIERAPSSATTTIDLSGYPSAVYVLTLRIGDQVRQWRVVKE